MCADFEHVCLCDGRLTNACSELLHHCLCSLIYKVVTVGEEHNQGKKNLFLFHPKQPPASWKDNSRLLKLGF